MLLRGDLEAFELLVLGESRERRLSGVENVPRRRCLLIRPSAARELSAWRTVVRLTS